MFEREVAIMKEFDHVSVLTRLGVISFSCLGLYFVAFPAGFLLFFPFSVLHFFAPMLAAH